MSLWVDSNIRASGLGGRFDQSWAGFRFLFESANKSLITMQRFLENYDLKHYCAVSGDDVGRGGLGGGAEEDSQTIF